MSESDTARIIELLNTGMTPNEVAYKIGKTVWYVRRLAQEAGYKFGGGPEPKVDLGRLRELVAKRLSLREMASVFGVSHSTVKAAMRRDGLKTRSLSEAKRDADEAGRGNVVLNSARVQKLRAERRRGATYADLARRNNITDTAARQAADGESWGHIAIPVCTEIGGAE